MSYIVFKVKRSLIAKHTFEKHLVVMEIDLDFAILLWTYDVVIVEITAYVIPDYPCDYTLHWNVSRSLRSDHLKVITD